MKDSSQMVFLCLICAPPGIASDRKIRVRLDTEVDWTAAVQIAMDHSLLPLFCSRLLTDFADFIPAELLAAMQTNIEQHRAKVGVLNTALLDILAQLEKYGVKAIPFKGPTLSQRAFGDAELRTFMDLDILIPEGDIDRALQCLIDHHYQHQAHMGPAEVAAVRRYGGQYFMFHPHTGVSVEPHWAFAPTTLAIDLDYDLLWQRTTTTTFLQQPVLALAPEHEALMLCIHASKEYWRSLKPVVDLAGYLDRQSQLDWVCLLEEARRWGCLRMLLLGLQLTRMLLDCDIHPACQPLIDRDSLAKQLARQLAKTIRKGHPPPVNPYRIDRYRLSLRERVSDKLRFVLRTICTPRSQHYALIHLPPALRWLYVPIKVGSDYLVTPFWRLVNRG